MRGRVKESAPSLVTGMDMALQKHRQMLDLKIHYRRGSWAPYEKGKERSCKICTDVRHGP
jgi:hypothetical protein